MDGTTLKYISLGVVLGALGLAIFLYRNLGNEENNPSQNATESKNTIEAKESEKRKENEVRDVPDLKESTSRRGNNRAPLGEVSKPAISVEESKSPAKGKLGEIEKTTPQQPQSTVIAMTNDPVAEVAPVKLASDAGKSGGRVAQRMKELSRFSEQPQQQATVAQQQTQVQQSSTSEPNVRNATAQPTTVIASKEKEKVEANADVWVTRGQPISTETIEGFTKKLSGWWTDGAEFVGSITEDGITLSSLPGSQHAFERKLEYENGATLKIVLKENPDALPVTVRAMLLDADSLALSFLMEEGDSSVELEASEKRAATVALMVRLTRWSDEARRASLESALEKLLNETTEKALEVECRKLERAFLVQWHLLVSDRTTVDVAISNGVRASAKQALVKLRKISPNAELLRQIDVTERRARSNARVDASLCGEWTYSLDQAPLSSSGAQRLNQSGSLSTSGEYEDQSDHVTFVFRRDGSFVMPTPAKNKKMTGSFVTYAAASAVNQIECLIDGESVWRKGIYKVEQSTDGEVLTLQWIAKGDFPANFSSSIKSFTLKKVIKAQGGKSTLAVKFIDEVKSLVAPILKQFYSDGYSEATKRQFVDLIFQIPPIIPLREGTEIFLAARKYSVSLQTEISQLGHRYSMQWREIVTLQEESPAIAAALRQSAHALY